MHTHAQRGPAATEIRNARQRRRAGIPRTWIAVFLLAFGAPATHAQAKLALELTGVDWRGRSGAGYDVYDATPYSQTAQLTVRHTGSACSFFVTFSKNTPGSNPRMLRSGADTLNYQIYDTPSLSNVLKDIPSALPFEVLSGSFDDRNALDRLSFVVALPPLQVKPAGTYTDTVKVTLYQGTPADATLAESATLQITARVAPMVHVAIIPTGGDFDERAKQQTLDFGELTEGKTLGLDLRVRSNAGYSATLQSENGGLLKKASSGTADAVPYQLAINNMTVPLSTESTAILDRRGALTGPNGDRYPLQVTIGKIEGASAGNYRDVLTITIQADN